MNWWKELLPREDLNDDQIRRLPGSSCESAAHILGYGIKVLGISEDEMLEGVSVDGDYLRIAEHWLDPFDDAALKRNLLRYAPCFKSHQFFVEVGRDFRFLPRSVLGTLYSMLPAGLVLQEVDKNIQRFNNYIQAQTLQYSPGEAYISMELYPFYRKIGSGSICHYLQGVIEANFTAHGISSFHGEHLLYGIDLEQLISSSYGHLGWTSSRQDGVFYLNGKPLAREIHLQAGDIGGKPCWFPQEDPHRSGPVALRVIEDVYYSEKLIFKADEVFNAPYSLMHVTWQEPNLLKRLRYAIQRRRRLPAAIIELQREMTRANERYFEASALMKASSQRSRIFRTYTKSSLAEQVEAGSDPTRWQPQRRNVAVLFCDIRNFTNLSESLSAEDVVGFLNSFFGRMNDLISNHHGEIDKLMGDCLMAQFANPDDAVDAAISMEVALQEFNRERNTEGLTRVEVGIGISFGPVVQGNIGSESRLDYTIVGDTVNVASRLESLTRHYQVRCIISEDVLARLEKTRRVRFLDRVQVKGKALPLSIYEVFEADPCWVKDIKHKFQPRYDLAYRVYQSGDFHRAVSMYAHIYRDVGPHSLDTELSADPLVLFYIDRCRELRDEVDKGAMRLDQWGGVYRFIQG